MVCHLISLGVPPPWQLVSARAAGARRRRGGGGLVAARAALGDPSPARTGLRHQLPVDDRVRPALPYEARPPDRRVDGVRGGLLGVEEADGALLAVRVLV